MKKLAKRLKNLLLLSRSGHFGKILSEVRVRLYSNSSSLGLERDLSIAFDSPLAKIPLAVRPLSAGDDLSFLEVTNQKMSGREAFDRRGQLRLLKAELQTCYIAHNSERQSCCYMQWLISPRENKKVQTLFGDLFPPLAKDEALLEGAYTHESYRGLGIMSCAMAQIAEKAKDFGARRVITFVSEDNIPSLKGCKKAGFIPFTRRDITYRLFHRKVRFTPLPEGTLKSDEVMLSTTFFSVTQ